MAPALVLVGMLRGMQQAGQRPQTLSHLRQPGRLMMAAAVVVMLVVLTRHLVVVTPTALLGVVQPHLRSPLFPVRAVLLDRVVAQLAATAPVLMMMTTHTPSMMTRMMGRMGMMAAGAAAAAAMEGAMEEAMGGAAAAAVTMEEAMGVAVGVFLLVLQPRRSPRPCRRALQRQRCQLQAHRQPGLPLRLLAVLLLRLLVQPSVPHATQMQCV